MVHKPRLRVAFALAVAALLVAQVAGYGRYPLLADWQPSPPVFIGALLLAFGAGHLIGRSIAEDAR